MKRIVLFSLLVCIGLVLTSTAIAGIKRVKTDRKVIALTFDDGPNPPHTENLLKVLGEKKVKVTFFLIGKQIEAHPETAKAILADGHEVGGHSYDWETLAFKKQSYVEAQLDKMDAAFASIGVTNLAFFRPPNGLLSPGQNSILKGRGLQHISADVLAGDWKDTTAEKIREAVLKKVRSGSVIVLHDGGGDRAATVAAAPQIIDALREQGYSFVTISELLEKK